MKKALLKISPSFDIQKLENASLNDKVDVYDDRVRGWLLCWAQELNKSEHAGFAALQIALAFFEGFAVFYFGEDSEKRSHQFFNKGFRLVFPQMDQLAPEQSAALLVKFYRVARCGLFHLGMVRSGVFLRDGDYEFNFEFNQAGEVAAIFINRHLFVQAINRRFEEYVIELRDESNVERRAKFEAAWELVHQQN